MGRTWWSFPGSLRCSVSAHLQQCSGFSVQLEDTLLLLTPRLSLPCVTLCPPQWQWGGCLLGVPGVGAPLRLLVCSPGAPFLFGCPGFVLTEEKSTGNKVEMFCREKEDGSSLAWLVFCLAFLKRIPRRSLENLKPTLQQTGSGRG